MFLRVFSHEPEFGIAWNR